MELKASWLVPDLRSRIIPGTTRWGRAWHENAQYGRHEQNRIPFCCTARARFWYERAPPPSDPAGPLTGVLPTSWEEA